MDKRKFVKRFGELIKQDQSEVEEVYLKDDKTVIVRFINGYEKYVNIDGDSNLAMVRSIAGAIMY